MTYDYSIITPAFNEAGFLPETISSIAGQTISPKQWIIVDDRSTDNTWDIINAAAKKYPFIKPVQISGKSERKVGENVVRVFNVGFGHLKTKVDFIIKMDADIMLEPDYFATLLEKFKHEPGLGMASGKTYLQHKGTWKLERVPDMHVSGACKTYRKKCFDDMGGLIPLLGWDILDCSKARMKGWKTRSFADLPIFHMRMTGSAAGMIKGRLRTGKVMYSIRANPFFVVGKSLYRAIERPYLAGLLIPLGYALSFAARPQRLDDLELARHLRKEQMGRLSGKNFFKEAIFSRKLNK